MTDMERKTKTGSLLAALLLVTVGLVTWAPTTQASCHRDDTCWHTHSCEDDAAAYTAEPSKQKLIHVEDVCADDDALMERNRYTYYEEAGNKLGIGLCGPGYRYQYNTFDFGSGTYTLLVPTGDPVLDAVAADVNTAFSSGARPLTMAMRSATGTDTVEVTVVMEPGSDVGRLAWDLPAAALYAARTVDPADLPGTLDTATGMLAYDGLDSGLLMLAANVNAVFDAHQEGVSAVGQSMSVVVGDDGLHLAWS